MNTNTPLPWREGKASDAIVSDSPGTHHRGVEHQDYYGGHVVAESVNASDRRAIIKAVNSHDRLVNALKFALLIIEKAKPYVIEHAVMTCDDMRSLGGDVGDAYWIGVVDEREPGLREVLAEAEKEA